MKHCSILLLTLFALIFSNCALNVVDATELIKRETTVHHQLNLLVVPLKKDGYLQLEDRLAPGFRPHEIRIPVDIENLVLKMGEMNLAYELQPVRSAPYQIIKPKYQNSGKTGHAVVIRYKYIPKLEDHQGGGMGHDRITAEVRAVIMNVGAYLSPASYWYPYINTLYEQFEITVESPKDWSTMTSGKLLKREYGADSTIEQWSIDYNAERIHLIANYFEINEESYRGVKLSTYFHQELGQHSAEYINKLKAYIDIYIDFFGSYPYEKFAVVSNFFSTGYGMASYTLLDKNIIPFPFIVDISLGHELLHNYWGNSVYVTEGTGNWCEGLTVYQADYLYEKMKSPAAAISYRRNIVRKYENFVNENNVIPVRDFRGRYNSATQAIGYGKVMMIFHMLKGELGEAIFNEGLQIMARTGRYTYQSWQNFREIYQVLSHRDLQTFFDQWVNRTDVLDLSLEWGQSAKSVVVKIDQKTKIPYNVLVQLKFSFEKAAPEVRGLRVVATSLTRSWRLDQIVPAGDRLVSVALDPNFELMRRPTPTENPSTLNKFWGSLTNNYYSSLTKSAELQKMLDGFAAGYDNQESSKKSVLFFNPQNSGDLNLTKSTFFFLKASDLTAPIYQKILQQQDLVKISDGKIRFLKHNREFSLSSSAVTLSLPYGERMVVLYIVPDEQKMLSFAQKLSHYGKYSYVLFNSRGRKEFAGIWGE